MTTNYFLGSILFFISLTVYSQTLSDQLLTPEQVRMDFARFRTALHEAHPAMYCYTPKVRFDSLFTATAARLNHPITQHEYYVTMKPLLVALRDGHIEWLLQGQDEHYSFFTDSLFPLKLHLQDDKAWVVGSYEADIVTTGGEVVAINDQPTATVISKLLPKMTVADGATITGKFKDLNHFFSGF